MRSPWTAKVALATALVLTTGCGAGMAGRAAPGAAGVRRAPNPAVRAAGEVLRLQQVVPFTPDQVQKLVPILQQLAQDPNEPPAELQQKAQEIEAVFTPEQQQALRNMAAGGGTPGADAGRAAFPGSDTGGGPQRRLRGQGPGAARGPADPSRIYTLALQALQGSEAGASSAAAPGGYTAQ
jgi:uncharacterized protein (DUF1778 family)